MAAAAVAGAAEQPQQTHRSTWVLLEINEAGESTILAAKPSHQPPAPCRLHPHVAPPEAVTPDMVVITYPHPETGEACHVPNSDPRKLYHDDHDGTPGGKFTGGVHNHAATQFAVTLPVEATQFHVHDMKNSHKPMARHMLTQSHHDAFHTLQSAVSVDTSKIAVKNLQVVGSVDTQTNFVFISSGFTESEKASFETIVGNLLTFLQGSSSIGVSAKPYMRYYSTFNMFQVWHPSTQSGASRPGPAGDGKAVSNNLDCSYGANSQRILTCNRAKVSIVGSYAPPSPQRAIYIIIVNDATFGGTGGGRICSVYSGAKMPVVLIHEIGHAIADLADEYDYGVTEPREVKLKNCYQSNDQPPWNSWILAGVLPRPTPVCTYTNYFKPTPSTCLMESENPTMCPVCAQSIVTTLYTEGVNLASPRYPGPSETLYLPLGTSTSLFINNRVPYHKDDSGSFDVQWIVGSAKLATATHAFGFNFNGAPKNHSGYTYTTAGSYNVSVVITDVTNMMLAVDRTRMSLTSNISSMRQVHVFRIVVYDPATSTPNCTQRATAYSTTQCVKCDAGAQCDFGAFTSTPLQVAYDVNGSLSGIEGWLLGVGGFFLALGIVSFGLIWKSMAMHHENTIREILPLGPAVKVLRISLMVVQIFVLIASTMSIVFCVYMFSLLSVFGRTIILGILGCSVVVWFVTYVGFCASYYKNRTVMFVNFILLLLLVGCSLLFASLVLYIFFNIDSTGVRDQLHAEWKDGVTSNPQAACTLQAVLYCSGFNTSCITVNSPAGTSDCPAKCEVTNQIAYPCYLRIKAFVLSNFAVVAVAASIFCFFMLLSLILSLIVGCGIKRNKLHVTRQRLSRAERGESTLSPEEIEMLRQEFGKINKNGSGYISREEFAMFYNDVMGAKLNARQLEEYFDKLDADQSGTLSFDEFVKVYVPQRKPKKRTLSEAKKLLYADPAAEASPASPGEEPLEAQAQQAELVLPSSAQSQRQPRPQDIELDLLIDDDDLPTMAAEAEAAAIRMQEDRAREEASKIAAAQEERQKRLALDRPSELDVALVIGDLGGLGGGAEAGAGAIGGDDFENLDIDFELDDA